jgi:DNA polymerase-4
VRRLPAIVHLDADAFFISCEQARNPSLRGKKCAVGGAERGIISSASYEARACGVYTPMPTRSALKVCPELILVRHTSGLYGRVSRAMFDLCETLTPIVQRNSIDEGYLDLRPCGFSSEAEIETAVLGLQRRITTELQISASFGLATNRLVAQIASKLRKPGGFVVVPPNEEAGFLAPLSVGRLPGVGPKAEAWLAERGLRLIGDIARCGERELRDSFGDGWREMLARAQGEDPRPVEPEQEDAKSYSQQETFSADIGEFAAIERICKRMLDELMAKVRGDGKRVRTLTLRLRYPDFSQESRGRSLDEASDLEAPFYPMIGPLLRAAWSRRRPLRLVSVRLSGVEDGAAQLEMFATEKEKRQRLAAVLDRLNSSGREAVRRGHQLS